MNKILFFIGLFIIPFSLQAQDTTNSISNVEQFINDPGYVVGHKLYDNATFHIALMKYLDPISKDSIMGIVFYNGEGMEPYSNSLENHVTYLDIEEVNYMISWIEFVKHQISQDLTTEYLAYVPRKGNLMVIIQKDSWPNYWFCIRYNKFDPRSINSMMKIEIKKDGPDFSHLDAFTIVLKEMQKLIDGTRK